MHLLIISIASVATLWGLYRSLSVNDGDELTQASLLPFADDPDAALRVEAATGLHCDEIYTPADDTQLAPGNYLKA